MSMLHSGGKFSGKAYATSGGLHGVGVSVVNALSSHTRVEVARDRQLYAQEFSRGVTQGPLQELGPTPNRRGTTVSFTPDTEIFGDRDFSPKRLFKLARSKAEDGRVSVRNIRRTAKQALEKLEKDGEVGKDDVTGAEKRLDAMTKTHTDQIDELLKHKEAELLAV